MRNPTPSLNGMGFLMISKHEGVRRLAYVAGFAVWGFLLVCAIGAREKDQHGLLFASFALGFGAWLTVHAVTWVIDGFRKKPEA
ncbi:hypothetical protein AncyloWKF20_07665 [Ancylobacter sp. WKF20]|uniref:hypothetical protein n=1 Tax=Ancylobacter sp. WKF20 TaxID=3039801 RepID=UPI0024342F8B|nr:hypothetical protein [Ancylobacter sp. WKF20]WGD31687.1 hypothetical protein AncyloWKF20_07665 [Ancylobacter sp. WKF20]